ncbi:allophanate hydrolase [Paenibacillus sp. 19GGS1-52]|uniref:allophanate hydrolase n=1 Tax=Paenibacillus sp. 19GGS1-52 TaxID=2758563 RepID=UPI001EFBA95B|nr:allophanate hydrolase [Paenibacillus sp. 19GGS1-52]ULO08181.1 allophanate hydrolase [Paenibacillus sp. 19GGS1-52]
MNSIAIPRVLSIKWLRDMYTAQLITPEEIIQEIINRSIEDADMNIWIVPPTMVQLSFYLDRLKTLDLATSPLWGIPFAIKDNIDLEGVETTAGCPEFSYLPTEHAVVVDRMIQAGAIPLGKTNLDQFATGLVGTRSPYGETNNALRKELISGGSSSGSAVAVARGQAAFAFGTDTAGSGRVPAALNNLVGYKPSLGAWPTKGVVPACASLDCVTVFTHSIEEALEVDAAARGIDKSDPWSKDYPQPHLRLPKMMYLPKTALDFYGPHANEYRSAWNAAIKNLQKMNLVIEYIDYDIFAQAAAILYEGPWVAERWADLGPFIDSHRGISNPVTEKVLRSGADDKHTAASVFQAMHKLQEMKRITRNLMNNAVMIMPTCGGTWTRDQVRQDPIGTNSDMGRYTNHCNLLDLCAVAVPAGHAAEDTPFGITFFALAENEDLICGAADLFQDILQRFSPLRVETTLVAVCGLHMRGFPLEKQMHEFGARFIREEHTATKYQMVKLPTTPSKPGLIKKARGGASIHLEVWEMPLDRFGYFAALIPAPLGMGKVELQDGSEIPGFVCEAYAETGAEDITAVGSWKNV